MTGTGNIRVVWVQSRKENETRVELSEREMIWGSRMVMLKKCRRASILWQSYFKKKMADEEEERFGFTANHNNGAALPKEA